MMYDVAAVARGLKVVVFSALLAAVGAVLLPFGLLGAAVSIASVAVGIYGYHLAAQGHPDFMIVMYFSIANLVLGLLMNVLGWVPFLGMLLEVANAVCGALVVYVACTAVEGLLDFCGRPVRLDGQLVWKVNVVSALAGLLLTLVGNLPVLDILAGLLSLPVALVAAVGSVLYFVYLWQAQKVLRNA